MKVGIGLPIPGTKPDVVLEWARTADAGPFSSQNRSRDEGLPRSRRTTRASPKARGRAPSAALTTNAAKAPIQAAAASVEINAPEHIAASAPPEYLVTREHFQVGSASPHLPVGTVKTSPDRRHSRKRTH
jgi:hypothetical protein